MINKESKVLKLFAREPWRKFTFTEIQKLTKNKSKSYLLIALNNFLKQDIISKENIGRSSIYSLNFSPKTRLFSGFVLESEGWDKRHLPYKKMKDLMNKIPTKNYILLVTGSYAKETQKETSDLDMVIIVDDSMEIKRVYAELTNFCRLSIPEIHLYVFKNKEFIEMLTNKEHNYGKEIIKKNIILYGGEVYMQLIQEAMDNGFTNKNFY